MEQRCLMKSSPCSAASTVHLLPAWMLHHDDNEISSGASLLCCVPLITLLSFDQCNQWIRENGVGFVRSRNNPEVCNIKFYETFCFDAQRTRCEKNAVIFLSQQNIQFKEHEAGED